MVQQTIVWTKFESFGKRKGTGTPTSGDYENGVFQTSLDLEGNVITVYTEREINQALKLVFI